jgi:hypothetical protein
MRRSPKSIETMRQAEFIIHYARYIRKLIEHQQREAELANAGDIHQLQQGDLIPTYVPVPEPGPLPLINDDMNLTVPSNAQIATLEAQVSHDQFINSNLFTSNGQQLLPPSLINRAHSHTAIMARSHSMGLYPMESNEEILHPIYM